LVDLYQGVDPRHVATYTTAEAVRYLRVPSSTLRSWVFGTQYKTQSGSKRFEPVIQLPEPEVRLLSFTNLVELHVLNAIRRHHKISLEKVRHGITYIKKSLNTEHPLAYEKLYTDGVDLFVEHLGQFINTSASLGVDALASRSVNASRHGQLAIPEIVRVYLKRIEWDEFGWATRLFPFTRSQETELPTWIVIDSRVSFGQPVVVDTGVPTAMFAQRYAAGESIDELATDYGCDRLKVEEAIHYELSMAA
jgi:uncharacterized protein (DUF433 family)